MKNHIKSMVRRNLNPLHRLIVRQHFKVERALIHDKHSARSEHQSIIHFSVQRAGTQYTKGILRRCAIENKLVHIGFSDYAWHSDFPYLNQLSGQELSRYTHIFKPSGYLYSTFHGLVEPIPHFSDYVVVLMVRDPRDVLTSRYFSTRYSHPLPGGQNKFDSFARRRAFAESVEIDDYVIVESEQLRRGYERYLNSLLGKPNVLIIKYEDMIGHFVNWLDMLLNHCDLAISAKLKRKLIEEADRSRPRSENVSKHIRQVTPGDHKRKLRPETIARLNTCFFDVLGKLEYEQI